MKRSSKRCTCFQNHHRLRTSLTQKNYSRYWANVWTPSTLSRRKRCIQPVSSKRAVRIDGCYGFAGGAVSFTRLATMSYSAMSVTLRCNLISSSLSLPLYTMRTVLPWSVSGSTKDISSLSILSSTSFTSFVPIWRSPIAFPASFPSSSLNSNVYFCLPIWESNSAFHFPTKDSSAPQAGTANASANEASATVLIEFFIKPFLVRWLNWNAHRKAETPGGQKKILQARNAKAARMPRAYPEGAVQGARLCERRSFGGSARFVCPMPQPWPWVFDKPNFQ